MNMAIYTATCKEIRRILNKMGDFDSIGHHDVHDIAMSCMMETNNFNKLNIRHRVFDLFRQYLGRGRRKRRYVQIPPSLVDQPKSERSIVEVLGGLKLNANQRKVAIALSQGMPKQDIAKMLGVSATMVSSHCRKIRKVLLDSGQYNSDYYRRHYRAGARNASSHVHSRSRSRADLSSCP